ncbi:CLUMA_CG014075, isoform A [Clunio marinus]|uniref:CLUMA_CG014075, isoform A n=1 Tax=Clunio marinus TaxID=568069 RepID=A0A1J1IKY1_9DIPT|nr:CLUMA_CG014075, isoform A [Clunio marinus]
MMSFSKAKLKRFNDITDFASPFTKDKSKKEKKADLFLDDNAIPSEKKSKLRLFRTPSLPYRLKFRQVSDLTPSKKISKKTSPDVEIPAPSSISISPQIESIPPSAIFRKSERNILEKKSRDEKYIEKLKSDIDNLNKTIKSLQLQNLEKHEKIDDLSKDIESMRLAEDFLEKIAEQAISKVHESDTKVKEILRSYDILLHHMDRMSSENEKILEINNELTKSNEEFVEMFDEKIKEKESELIGKNEELNKLKLILSQRNNKIKNFEFELGKKTMECYDMTNAIQKSEEHMKIFEVQHEESLKMLRGSYENEIFFLNSQLSKVQNQLVKLSKNQKKAQSIDLESQIEFENQKAKFEIEKKNYDITIKNYQNIIEVLSLRLKKSDTDVEVIMTENADLKTEISELRRNYDKLRHSAENLKKSFDEKNLFFEQLMMSSEKEMITVVSKMNDYFNEKFVEISELKKGFDIREKNTKTMTSAILEEYSIGIELAKIELSDKQKKLEDYDNEMKAIKLENLQLKLKLNENYNKIKSQKFNKVTTDENVATAADDDEVKNLQQSEEENMQLRLRLKELDRKFTEFEKISIQRENDYKTIIEQQRLDSEQWKSFENLKESNIEIRSKIQKLQENYQIFDSPNKTPTKRSLFFGKENQSPIFSGPGRLQVENSPKSVLKPRN